MIAASTSVPIFTWIADLAGDLGEQQGHEPQGPFENGRKRVRTGVGSDTQNQQNRRNDPPLVADAKIPLSAVVAQHRVPVAQSCRIESYPAGVAPRWRT
ncbi:hypothetical protein NKH49_27900 [Mesorhizobium sp. M1088]|uniref:hypothetical protein n=1 Tax=Mesorhizobium sp. M1088 TaxID=2957056 RepID=UPI00333621A6